MAAQHHEILYGRNAVRESLRANRRTFMRVTLADGLARDERLDEIIQLAEQLKIEVRVSQRRELDDFVDANHQGVLLHAEPYPYTAARDFAGDTNSIVLALDEVADPRNVGTLLRSAEATACDLVIIPEHRSASITPAVVNASSGAVEHLSIARETNLVQWLRWASGQGMWIVGLDHSAKSSSLFEADIPMPCVIVVGSEGSGLRRLVREHCDLLVSIPMYGKIESLNVAVAGSLALYEVREYAVLGP